MALVCPLIFIPSMDLFLFFRKCFIWPDSLDLLSKQTWGLIICGLHFPWCLMLLLPPPSPLCSLSLCVCVCLRVCFCVCTALSDSEWSELNISVCQSWAAGSPQPLHHSTILLLLLCFMWAPGYKRVWTHQEHFVCSWMLIFGHQLSLSPLLLPRRLW